MTRQDLLLIQLGEEACEVSQAIAKQLRFGPNNKYPTQDDETAGNRVVTELIDLACLVDMCKEEGIIPSDILDNEGECVRLMSLKRQKVEKYLEYSRKQGVLND